MSVSNPEPHLNTVYHDFCVGVTLSMIKSTPPKNLSEVAYSLRKYMKT